MNVNINTITEKGLTLNDSIDLEHSLLLDEAHSLLESIEYELVLRREEQRIKAKGRIKTTISLNCVRCMEPFDFKVSSRFDIILFPADLIEAQNLALNADELEYIFYEGDQIDIHKILAEQVNLFLPNYPVCHSSCRGICPNCGTNLNHTECKCDDSRNQITFLFEKTKR